MRIIILVIITIYMDY